MGDSDLGAGTTAFFRDREQIFPFPDPTQLTCGYFGYRTVRSHLVIRNFTVKSAPLS